MKKLAEKAWWTLDLGPLQRFVGHLQIGLRPNGSLLGALVTMTGAVLGVGEGEGLGIVAQRLSHMEASTSSLGEVLDVLEAWSYLTQENEKVFVDEKDAAKKRALELDSFSTVGGCPPGRHPHRQRRVRLPRRRRVCRSEPPSLAIYVRSVRRTPKMKYLPPGALMWKSRVDGPWCDRLPPLRTMSRNWPPYSEPESLRLVLAIVVSVLRLGGH